MLYCANSQNSMGIYNFIISKIEDAGGILLDSYGKSMHQEIKNNDPRDIVTEADLRINDFLSKAIKNNFPQHSIYSEESPPYSSKGKNDEYLWVLDPIDGTSNFLHQTPHFAISMGLIRKGRPFAGAIFNPVTRELFSFKQGEGAYLNDVPLHVSSVTDIDKAFVLMLTGRAQELHPWGVYLYNFLLKKASKTRSLASSALDICFVAAGRADACIYGQLTTLDIAPAIGVLLEAGGAMTNAEGAPAEISAVPQKIIVSNNTKLHDVLVSELRRI